MSALTLVRLSGQGPAGSPFGLMLISIPCVADAGGRLTSAVRLVMKRQAAPTAAREIIVLLNFRCMYPPSVEMPRGTESFRCGGGAGFQPATSAVEPTCLAREPRTGWRPRHRS